MHCVAKNALTSNTYADSWSEHTKPFTIKLNPCSRKVYRNMRLLRRFLETSNLVTDLMIKQFDAFWVIMIKANFNIKRAVSCLHTLLAQS
jgi:hypothetical protein